MNIKDLFKYQDDHGELAAYVKADNEEELKELEEVIIDKVGVDVYEAYYEARLAYSDKLREQAYIQGFIDAMTLLKN